MNDQGFDVAPYKDRSTGLVVFGILTIFLGGIAGLFVPLMVVSQIIAATQTKVPTNPMAIVSAVFIYGFLSVALIWLGIGALKAQRWARALLLIFSWIWLVTGVLAIGMMAFMLPKIFSNLPANQATGQPAVPPSMIAMIMVVAFVFYGFILVVLPAIWTYFFSGRNVKATCEARHPIPCWTDACPLPVLGVVVMLAVSVPMFLTMPFAYKGVFPFFGTFLTGIAGSTVWMVLGVICGGSAWLMYRLDSRGWWMITVAMIVFGLSSFITYSHHDIFELYQLMDIPQEQIDQIKKLGILGGSQMAWMSLLYLVPAVIYLLFIKRHFGRKA